MTTALQLDSVSKSYGDIEVLKDVSFDVPEGTIVGFIGPNGAGKSTTMRIAAGLARPNTGSVSFWEKSLSEYPAPMQIASFGLEPSAMMSAMKVRDWLSMMAEIADVPLGRVEEAIANVGLSSASRRYIGALSTGMRQRVLLAQVLLCESRLILLDEPLNGLDADAVVWVNDRLKRLAGNGTAVLVSSHLLSELESICSKFVILSKGSIVYDGPLADMRDDPRVVVRATDMARLRHVLMQANLSVVESGHDALEVACSAEEVFSLAVSGDVVLTHLAAKRTSLVEIYRGVSEGAHVLPSVS